MKRWPTLAAVGMLAGIACSTFESTEAPADGGDDAGGDGALDGTTGDAGADAISANDATADARLCVDRDAAICDDFDDPTLGAQWRTDLQPSGTIILDGGGRSPPNAVVFTADGGDNAAHARIHREIAGGSRLRCAFDLRYDAKGTAGFEIARVAVSGNAQTASVVLTSNQIRTISDGGMSAAFTPTALDTWASYVLVIDLTSQKASITPSMGTVDVQLVGFPPGQLFDVSFGLQFLPSGQTTFRVDNVVCTVE